MLSFSNEDLTKINISAIPTAVSSDEINYVLACFAALSQCNNEETRDVDSVEAEESDFETYTRLTSFSVSSDDEDVCYANDDVFKYNVLTRNDLFNVSSAVGNCLPTEEVYKLYDWKYISTLKLSPQDYAAYSMYLDWNIVSRHIDPEVALEYFKAKVCWDTIASCNTLDIKKYIAHGVTFSLHILTETQSFTEEHLHELVPAIEASSDSAIVWMNISKNQKLSEQFIERYFDKLDKFAIVGFQHISFDFILRNKHRLSREDVLFFHDFTDEQRSLLGW